MLHGLSRKFWCRFGPCDLFEKREWTVPRYLAEVRILRFQLSISAVLNPSYFELSVMVHDSLEKNQLCTNNSFVSLYRVIQQVSDLGCVDLDLGYSIILPGSR